MTEQKAVPEIPEDLRAIYERAQAFRQTYAGGRFLGARTTECLIERIAALTAENTRLREQAEALSKPVSEDEALQLLGEDRYDMRGTLDALIASRAARLTPPTIPNSGTGNQNKPNP